MTFLKPQTPAKHFHEMQQAFGNLTFDKGTPVSREADGLAFACREWACTGPLHAPELLANPEVQVTEVSIRPDNCYCFEVMVSGRNVAAFSFDDLGSATAAANAMRRLAPAVSTVLLQMRTGKFKGDGLGLDGGRFW